MLSSSEAFLWVVWRQHRWGLLVVLCAWLLAATLANVAAPLFWHRHAYEIFGFLVFPLLSVTAYPVVIFTYGFDAGDVLARESCFPTAMLRLPVRTFTLVVWPIVFGVVTTFLLWFATTFLILRPWVELWNGEMPLWWPSMMALAILAWLQALLWMPFGLPWLRAVLVLIMVQAMIAAPIYCAHAEVAEGWLVAAFAGMTVIAWGLSFHGVHRGRRGEVPNWEGIFSNLDGLFRARSNNRQAFASADLAQAWFEWRSTGKVLPIVTGVLLPLAFLQLFLRPGNARGNAALSSMLCAAAIPVFFAGVAGWLGRRRSRLTSGHSGMMPMIATLPITTADMVGAALKAAKKTTLVTWLIIIVGAILAIVLSGSLHRIPWWRNDTEILFRMLTGGLAIVAVVFVWTWKRSLDSLFVGCIGSRWIEAVIVWGSIPATYCLGVFVATIYVEPLGHYAITLALWPWFLGGLILVRLLMTTWALAELMRQGLVRPRTAAWWATAWLLLAAVLFALLACTVPTERVPRYDLACGVLFALPMVRLTAAPLVVAWSRHR